MNNSVADFSKKEETVTMYIEQFDGLFNKLLFTVQKLTEYQNQYQHLNICNAEGYHLVTASEIVCCQTIKSVLPSGNISTRISIKLTDGRDIVSSTSTINLYEQKLYPFLFAKINRSCLVNFRYVKLYNPRLSKIVLRAFQNLPEQEFHVSKNYRLQVEMLYNTITLGLGNEA